MTQNQIGDKQISSGSKFGLGFELLGEKGSSNHLVSKNAYRCGGMYYTDSIFDSDEDLVIIFYTNVQPFRGSNIHKIFRNLVYQEMI